MAPEIPKSSARKARYMCNLKSKTLFYIEVSPRWVKYRPRVLGAVFIGARNSWDAFLRKTPILKAATARVIASPNRQKLNKTGAPGMNSNRPPPKIGRFQIGSGTLKTAKPSTAFSAPTPQFRRPPFLISGFQQAQPLERYRWPNKIIWPEKNPE
jgi:hypothetical protein